MRLAYFVDIKNGAKLITNCFDVIKENIDFIINDC